MRIALAQMNPTLGDFAANAKKIIDFSRRAQDLRAEIVLFPEATLFGYHPMDLLERPSVVDAQLKVLGDLLKKLPKDILVIIGVFTKNKKAKGKPFHNSALAIRNGKIVFQCHKELLPTYDVFDDARHIEPGDMSKNILKFKGKKVFVTICEDIWAWPVPGENVQSFYPENPIQKIKPKSVDLVLNLSASPFHVGKFTHRQRVVTSTAKYLKAPMAYVNMVGAQDELVFDGGSFAVAANGKTLCQSVFFEEDLTILDLDTKEGGTRPRVENTVEQIRRALVLGIRDFCEKAGLQRVHLGLSGGIDSAVVACLAVDALGPKNVDVFYLQGPFSSDESGRMAGQLAENLGLQLRCISIEKMYGDVNARLTEALGPHEFGHAEENIQSRLRGLLLMAYSNREGSLLLNTTNKTEMASGYGTLYGDMIGGLCPIGDLLKRDVFELAKHYNQQQELIPAGIITRPPSAELAPNQKDEDSLPLYSKLDPAVRNMVERLKPARSHEEKFLLRAMYKSEFKRWQAPPILKVREHSFGRGRRFPVAHKAFY